MNQSTSPTEVCLRSLLSTGPRNSREVLAAMATWQFTPKQVRRARERQGIMVERSGNGAAMHSTWRLPDIAHDNKNTAAAAGLSGCGAVGLRLSLPSAVAGSAPCTEMQWPDAHRTEGEQRRHQARVAAFIKRGIDARTAGNLADALVARDRDGLRGIGSCAECQCAELKNCPTTPRPVAEVHLCWYRRQCTP